MAKLPAMVDGAVAGKHDYLVFSFSSHGTQVPDAGGDEPDNADEAFCPYDLQQNGDHWHPDHIITDDELNTLFAAISEQVTLEVFPDTCHSGTGLRAIDLLLDRKPRYLPHPRPWKRFCSCSPSDQGDLPICACARNRRDTSSGRAARLKRPARMRSPAFSAGKCGPHGVTCQGKHC